MKRNRRKKQRRERLIMIGSSLFVLTALTMTGIYVKDKNNAPEDGYVVDLSQLETKEVEEVKTETQPNNLEDSSEAVSSSKVENADELWEKDYSSVLDYDYDFWEDTIGEPMEEEITDFFVKEEETLSFSEEDKMLWPTVGNILINYSMDSPVYFSTLEQYKYHPAIVIGGKEGQNIMAAARGRVTKIEKTEELGTVLTMELGNGYEVIYGQLNNLQVKEGDLVEKGAYIADIAKTTKYYSVEGDNVYFAVKKDGQPVNPMTKLQ